MGTNVVGFVCKYLIVGSIDVKIRGVERGWLRPMNQIERFCKGDILTASTRRTLTGALGIIDDVAPWTIHEKFAGHYVLVLP